MVMGNTLPLSYLAETLISIEFPWMKVHYGRFTLTIKFADAGLDDGVGQSPYVETTTNRPVYT